MLEKEAREKWCPMSPAISICKGSDCMMWSWETAENMFIGDKKNRTDGRDYTLEEMVKHHGYPEDGWERRPDKFRGWKRPFPQEERQGSCGLANLTVYVEGP